ncbi:sulfatase-like hydrolase/transferase [Chitinophaga lutea]
MSTNTWQRRLLFMLAILWAAPVWAQRSARPNIIIILADDMGRECLGAYGSTYQTPNLDALAKEGLKFNYGFSQPLCTPSRVQIMTGQYNYRNYVEFGYLDPQQHTFAHLAKAAGYKTAIAGKWQLGFNNKLPAHFGFDRYCLWQLSYRRGEGERYAKALIEQDGKTLPTSDDLYGPDVFTDYLLQFIEENKNQPFLAYYPMALVHDPFLPTPDSKSWRDDAAGRHRRDTANFRDMVAYTDKNVGRILAKLKALGLYDNTIVIFTGDNGTGRAILTPMKDGSKVKGGKGLTLDRGHHVPLIVNWGGKRYKRHETDELVDFTDILPTVAEAIGQKIPGDWASDGRSILPWIAGSSGTPRKWIFSHYTPLHNADEDKHAARFFRDHRYKLYHDGRLYDLVTDPEEQRPIEPGTGGKAAESARQLFAAEFAKLPAWKPGDPGRPKVVLPGLEARKLK